MDQKTKKYLARNGGVVRATPSPATKDEPMETGCSDLVTNLGASTTCHALPSIIIGDSFHVKLVWLVICLSALAAFVLQAYQLVTFYLRYEVKMQLESVTPHSLPFPSVTICNTNKLRLSEIINSDHSPLAKTDPEHPNSIHKLLSYDAPCLPGDYECADSQRCIKQHLRCDGYIHCWDGFSDEVNCTYPSCGKDEFRCPVAGFHGVCIPKWKRCDGVHHCIGGDDERNCSMCSTGLACDFELDSSGYRCIPERSVCDRFPDCIDGADEARCDFVDICENGRLVALSEVSVLYSPNYPSDYGNNHSCVIQLTAARWHEGQRQRGDCILLSFLELDVERSKNCEDDYIEIRDSDDPNIMTRLCGSSIPPPWISSSSRVIFTFVSNSGVTGRGYRIQYSLIECQSSNYWAVGPWNECTKTCGGGYRQRYAVCSAVGSPADLIVNSSLPVNRADSSQPVRSVKGAGGCHMYGNADAACIAPGSPPVTVEFCNTRPCPDDDRCGAVLTGCSMDIVSPGYPSDYPPNMDCETMIVNEEGCIALNIVEMDIVQTYDCHKDYLKYIETQPDGDFKTELFCGQHHGLRRISPSSQIQLVFHSDSIISGRGFKASYEFVPCGTWHTSVWSRCSVTCGRGIQMRRVKCVGRTYNKPIDDKFCPGEKPMREMSCDILCKGDETPKITNDLEFLYGKYKHITDDVRVYTDFLNNYYKPNNFERVDKSSDLDWIGYLTYSSSPDYSDLQNVLHLPREDVARFGHQAEDFILQCSFDDSYCDHRAFHAFENDRYGNCFTFNSWQMNSERSLNSSRPGSQYGLRLTLFIEQDEYIPLYGQEAGVRVLVHPADVTPFPEDEGITVAPGLKTSIGLRMETTASPSMPYANCSNKQNFKSIYGEGYAYSNLDCHKTRIHQYIHDECGCVDTMHMKGKPCHIAIHREEICRQLVEYLYKNGILQNGCTESCSEVHYQKTISQSQWPSNNNVKSLLTLLRPLSEKITKKVVDQKSVRDNLLRLNVYYEELEFRKLSKLPAYSIEELLADIGGTLSLCIGMSLITVVELLDFLLAVLRHLVSRTTNAHIPKTASSV
ncbi:uncharacterized protein [Ptychodera flava]|uniref:uncharacterized protein n=1 Tax=Ptychodera flava TaxID=63121 RepID=UPI00396A4E2F